LAAFGVTEKPPEQEEVFFELMPENVDPVVMFTKCATQWRVGMNGLIGLDYSVLFHLMELYSIKDKVKTFEGVQIMESAVLKSIQKSS
jgi:hypothetical protein